MFEVCYNSFRIGDDFMNNNFNYNGNKIMQVSNENVTEEKNTVNHPFEVMNKKNNDSEKKLKKGKS